MSHEKRGRDQASVKGGKETERKMHNVADNIVNTAIIYYNTKVT